MKSIIAVLVLCLPPALSAQFVPDAFQPPRTYSGRGYKLVPLGPDVAELDFKAYMGSIDHIRSTMGGKWPNPNLTMADQAKDMAGEKAQWDGRKSFPYAILSADGTKELGCFYIRPSGKVGYDAAITLWVTKDQFDAGLEKQLIPEMKAWLAAVWPFKKPAWPGREIPMSVWRALPAAPPN